MREAPAQSYKVLRKFLPAKLQPILRGLRKQWSRQRPRLEPYRTVYPHTQAYLPRQENLVRLAETIERECVSGDVVECGVLDGGTAALMAWATRQSGRRIHLFDSWRGLPDAITEDGAGSQVWNGECVGSISRVRAVMDRLSISDWRIVFHRGWFDQTFPTATIEKIALLHIDADFYGSVRLTLETWFPRVVSGGFIQFDDYSEFIGCKRAVDDFLSRHPELRLESICGDTVFFLRRP